MHVCNVWLSVHKEQLGSHWTDFYKIWCVFFQKSLKVQVSLKYDKDNRYFPWRRKYIYGDTLLNSS